MTKFPLLLTPFLLCGQVAAISPTDQPNLPLKL
jgi:hypothetical protein